jgi:type II restriction/modification system DNA methylase subunit YeeA
MYLLVELLLPNNLLQVDNVISDLIEMVPEADFENIEVIGWLYQFYISERKDEVFASHAKVGKDDIPAATQIFTPKWIVEYLVDNSLGRLWLEHQPTSALRNKLNYYLDNGEQHSSDELNPEAIKIMDPSCGSGHMLVYAFDVLYEIYLEKGYVSQDIPKLILAHNLYGLDIDRRAAQLAAFALIMKARSYDRRLFRRGFDLHIQSIESGHSNLNLPDNLDELAGGPLTALIRQLNQQFMNADTLGSIIKLNSVDTEQLTMLLTKVMSSTETDMFLADFVNNEVPRIEKLLAQYQQLAHKYSVVVTNPPYMGSKNMDPILSSYVKKQYPNSKADLFAVFMEVCLQLTQKDHYMAMINQHSWMFLSSFEKLRKLILEQQTMINMVHLGARAFAETSGEVVQSTMFVMKQAIMSEFKAQYVRLVDIKDPEQKMIGFQDKSNYFKADQSGFKDIPGAPVAYWASERVRKIFRDNPKLGEIAEPKQGLSTADNNRFLRLWYEVANIKTSFQTKNHSEANESSYKWFTTTKGGSYRKWYGNNDYVVNWENNGQEIINFVDERGKQKSRPQNRDYYFKTGFTWSTTSSSSISFRLHQKSIFEHKGSVLFLKYSREFYSILGYVNSNITMLFLKALAPTLDFGENSIAKLPYSPMGEVSEITNLVQQNIALAKSDWDAFETSWDFQQHPFLQYRTASNLLADAFANWQTAAAQRFAQLKANEEELNRQFIDIYGLQDELSPEETDKEVTVRQADQGRDVRSFLSYLVGVIFGRYSLDEPGLIYAGGTFERTRYHQFQPDPDNVIPIGFAKGYYEDDIVTRIMQLLTLIFGVEHLMANLAFIANGLYPDSAQDPEEALRRYFLKDFYKDHLKIYQKRPIYWELSSGKQNGFKALIYLHRYTPALLAQIRTAYLLPLMRTINRLLTLTNTEVDSTRAKAAAEKQRANYQRQLTELRQYETVVQYMANRELALDLDDGVKVNYAKFQDIEVPSEDGTKTQRLNILTKVKM